MPLWVFSHSPGIFSDGDMKDLATKITAMYTKVGLPPVYTNVQFFELPLTRQFVGGESNPKFTTLTIYHVARSFQNDEQKQKFLDKVDSILNPVMKAKEMSWEYFIMEGPRELWKINGIVPPPTGSDEEKRWLKENRIIPRDEDPRL